MPETRSTCPYCGVGCGVIIETDGGADHRRARRPGPPGQLRPALHQGQHAAPDRERGGHAADAAAAADAARGARRGRSKPIGWDAALDEAADRFAAIIDASGPDAVGFYVSGQLLTEDYYVFNKLAKGLVGTNNVDTNSRLCMSSAVAGYKATLGADAPPACYDDLGLARTLFIAGSNTAWAHPILFRRIEDAKRANPALKMIVVDPRRTDTAEIADLYLPIQPGTDVMLFNGMLHLMLWEGLDRRRLHRRAHQRLRRAASDRVRDYTPKTVAQVCGIDEDDLIQAARWFAGSTARGAPRSSSPVLPGPEPVAAAAPPRTRR